MVRIPRAREAAGPNNWIDTGFVFNPANLTQTITGTVNGTMPGFANLGIWDLSPGPGSPLLDVGHPLPASPAGYEIPNPLFPPVRHPTARLKLAPGTLLPRPIAGMLDIGAFELEDASHIFGNGFEG